MGVGVGVCGFDNKQRKRLFTFLATWCGGEMVTDGEQFRRQYQANLAKISEPQRKVKYERSIMTEVGIIYI